MACVIAAPCSGSGKTLLSLCLAALARQRGLALQPFKVGPDYLDPQLLTAVAGRPCRNLDTLLCGADWVQRCFQWHGSRADRVLVEGVMGLFDGRGPSSEGSTAEVASLLQLPVVLVVEASRQAGSLAALVRGFRDHGPPQVPLAGVVLNRVGSERHRALLQEALAAIEVPLLGVLPQHPALALPSRHLGLLPPGELADLSGRIAQWAALAEAHLDLERLWPLLQAPSAAAAGTADPVQDCLKRAGLVAPLAARDRQQQPVVAIATDQAFHFRYPEASELLEALGLQPRPWSPLADEPLPQGCRAIVLPGGYPELHGAQLAASHRSLSELARAAAAGLPIVAECGGLLLLGRSLCDGEDRPHAMAGVLPFSARRGSLTLGYRQAEACVDGLLVRKGERWIGHEFHRWQLCDEATAMPEARTMPEAGAMPEIKTLARSRADDQADDASNPEPNPEATAMIAGLWQLEGWGWTRRPEGWTNSTLHATWLHLHWAGCPVIPWRLAAAAASGGRRPVNGAFCSPPIPGPSG